MIAETSEQTIIQEIEDEALSIDRAILIFRYLLDRLSRGNKLHLYTLFSKISYLDSRIGFSDEELRALHFIRKQIEQEAPSQSDALELALRYAIRRFLSLAGVDSGSEMEWQPALEVWSAHFPADYIVTEEKHLIRASVVQVEGDMLSVIDEESGHRLSCKCNVSEVNEQFNATVRHLDTRIPLPVTVHFINNRFVDNKNFIPSAIVVDPDFLVDVTAIASCFTPVSELPLVYLMQQFLPASVSPYLVLGNIANTILDQLMLGQVVKYEDFVEEFFHQFALEFSLMEDDDVRMVMSEMKHIIANLEDDVKSLVSARKNTLSYIEPSFISSTYGIQGRLDALFLDEEYLSGEIVELKSGKPFMANEYGLSRNHYVQTLLYDMLIRSAFGAEFQSINYILYCRLNEDRLKQAPVIESVKYEALKVRNDIVAINYHLMNKEAAESMLFRFNHPVFQQAGGFIYRDAREIHLILSALEDLEKSHFVHFTSLLANENYTSKVGGLIGRNSYGFSALWSQEASGKAMHFNLLRKITIDQKLGDGVYRFSIRMDSALSNFRKGDIVVLYPNSRENSPVSGQLLKGSIIEIDQHNVDIRLRNPLLNSAVFESINAWNAEHDYLESGTRHGYRALLRFYSSTSEKRQLFLGLRPPRKGSDLLEAETSSKRTELQTGLLSKMLNTEEYYLLWGPPGTGKTSVMLADLVDHLIKQTNESLLLIAYTNRAVDEICDVIESIYPDNYMRVGSRYSVPTRFHKRLLQTKLRSTSRRTEVRKLLKDCRIVVGTLASISGKEALFSLTHFDTLVVDEASQILEPHILGLVARVNRTILIGDHKQLPAVVVAEAEKTTISDQKLQSIGFSNTSMSLFERLFRRCESMGWEHAIGKLEKQGRMHQDISGFVSRSFYLNGLGIADHLNELKDRLTANMDRFYLRTPHVHGHELSKRIEVMDVKMNTDSAAGMTKTNESEAELTAHICRELLNCLGDEATVGVICPFRAQIALIKSHLGDIDPDRISVDTVERYQGGARDVIVLSTCASNQITFDAIKSLDEDGVDRKLNVALSRAREQIILIGNVSLLTTDESYKALIDYSNSL